MPFSPKAAVFCTALGGDLLNLCLWGVQPRLVPGGLLHRGELLDLPGLAVQAQGNVVESGLEEEESSSWEPCECLELSFLQVGASHTPR